MENDEKYMRFAIAEAEKSAAIGGLPIGALIVKDGEVFVTGQSMVWPKKDPSAHAEIECMKAACKKIDGLDLKGCVLYSTLESCSMCLGCAGWSGLNEIVFGAYQEDVLGNSYAFANYHAEEFAQNMVFSSGQKLKVRGGVLREECKNLMKNVKGWTIVD